MNREEILNHVLTFGFGGMSIGELGKLYDITQDKNVLELGSMVGQSSYVIASVAKSLSCVDVWSDNQDHLSHDIRQVNVYKGFLEVLPNMFDAFNNNCKEFIKSKKIKIYKGNTRKIYKRFKDKSFDILLIDADHSYDGVSKDFELYHKKIKPEGLIIFHDYADSYWNDISKFCGEKVASGEIEIVDSFERLGIFTNT